MIDVSDPNDLAYCFLFPGTPPLNATEYLGMYRDELLAALPRERPWLIVQQCFKDLQDVRIVSPRALSEAWPRSYPRSSYRHLPLSGTESKHEHISTGADSQHGSLEPSSDIAHSIPSLCDLALRGAVGHSVALGDSSALKTILSLPTQAITARNLILEQIRAQGVPRDAVMLILQHLAEHEVAGAGALDLSTLQLSDRQILETTKHLHCVVSLNLSQNAVITASGVAQLLKALPDLRRLVLVNCPSCLSTELNELLSSNPRLFRNMDTIVHPLFLSTAEDSIWHAAFNFLAVTGGNYRGDGGFKIDGLTLPFVSLATVVQGCTDLSLVVSLAMSHRNSRMQGWEVGPAMKVAFSASARSSAAGSSWYGRNITAPPIYAPEFGAVQRNDWVFIFAMPGHECSGFGWAFVRLLPSAGPQAVDCGTAVTDEGGQSRCSANAERSLPELDFDIYDLRGFLDAMVQEGCTAVPEDDVRRAEGALEQLSDGWSNNFYMAKRERVRCPLMSCAMAAFYLKMVFKGYHVEGPDEMPKGERGSRRRQHNRKW